MRALTISEPGSITVATVPNPTAAEGEVVIRVAACGVCGTDLHIYEGSYMGSYPVIPGHEFAGTVEAVGRGVRRFLPGDRVAVEPNIACNNCSACLSNRQNFCENWQAVGVTIPGAMAEYVAVPENAAFSIGDLPFEEAAFVEPLSCVIHVVEKLSLRAGMQAAVIGAGPIGVLLMRTLLASGIVSISAAERNVPRRTFAADALAVAVRESADELESDYYDIVVDATGVPDAMADALRLARPGGEVLWFGVPDTGAKIGFEPFCVFRKGLAIHGSFTSVRNSIQAIDLLKTGTIRVDDLVTHRLSLDEVKDGFDALSAGRSEARKILVLP